MVAAQDLGLASPVEQQEVAPASEGLPVMADCGNDGDDLIVDFVASEY